jgi:hypothetical protein
MHTDVYTYFTQPDGQSHLLYSAEIWVRIEFQLETAGPVAVGTRQEIMPVLSGRGVLLPPDGEPVKWIMPRGDRIFIASETLNRVKVIIEPIPWLEQILNELQTGFSGIKGIFGGFLRGRKG